MASENRNDRNFTAGAPRCLLRLVSFLKPDECSFGSATFALFLAVCMNGLPARRRLSHSLTLQPPLEAVSWRAGYARPCASYSRKPASEGSLVRVVKRCTFANDTKLHSHVDNCDTTPPLDTREQNICVIQRLHHMEQGNTSI